MLTFFTSCKFVEVTVEEKTEVKTVQEFGL